MTTVSTRAIIFDLFGTLVPNFSRREFREVLEVMADTVSAPAASFAHLYGTVTYPKRITGELATTESSVEYVCEALGLRPEPGKIRAAARERIELTRRMLLTPLPGVLGLLTELRSRGYRLGLVSDCSAEVPLVWPKSPLAPLIDATVFSCEVGLRKPDQRIYLLACGRLQVTPEESLYIGDGSDRELSGAVGVGMRTALVRVAYSDTTDTDRPEVLTWEGLELNTLADVLSLVGGHPLRRVPRR